MRRTMLVLAMMSMAVPTALSGQLSDDELTARVTAARGDDADLPTLYNGAVAARLLGDFAAAEELLDDFQQNLNGAENALVNEMILQAIASGKGANGMMRAFREARARINMSPLQIATFVNNYPTLLMGGEFDELILGLSPDHPDPAYRCACLAPKAWVHRVAGRMEESRELWAQLAQQRDEDPLPADNPQAQGQRARDLARAGRTEEARSVLQAAMAMPVSDEQRPSVQRRWAQAYAELGDVAGAVAQLEPLLENSTLVTVNSLSTRYTWEPVRDDPAFQAMLARHR